MNNFLLYIDDDDLTQGQYLHARRDLEFRALKKISLILSFDDYTVPEECPPADPSFWIDEVMDRWGSSVRKDIDVTDPEVVGDLGDTELASLYHILERVTRTDEFLQVETERVSILDDS